MAKIEEEELSSPVINEARGRRLRAVVCAPLVAFNEEDEEPASSSKFKLDQIPDLDADNFQYFDENNQASESMEDEEVPSVEVFKSSDQVDLVVDPLEDFQYLEKTKKRKIANLSL